MGEGAALHRRFNNWNRHSFWHTVVAQSHKNAAPFRSAGWSLYETAASVWDKTSATGEHVFRAGLRVCHGGKISRDKGGGSASGDDDTGAESDDEHGKPELAGSVGAAGKHDILGLMDEEDTTDCDSQDLVDTPSESAGIARIDKSGAPTAKKVTHRCASCVLPCVKS